MDYLGGRGWGMEYEVWSRDWCGVGATLKALYGERLNICL